MLLGFGGRNCWCFKDWMQIDLSLGEGVPADVSMGLPACTAMCFKGANASGKTNALKVYSFIYDFVTFSFSDRADKPIMFASFFHNDDPAEFYVEFLANRIYYRYELTASQKAVITERLFRKKNEEGSRETEIFVREGNNVTKNTLYKGHKDILFRENASFISTLKQYNLPEISDIYDFFFKTAANVGFYGLNERGENDPEGLTKYYYNHPDELNFTIQKIKFFDTGIDNIEIRTRIDEKGMVFAYPVFHHSVSDKKTKPMSYGEESRGTQALYCKLVNYYEVLSKGGVLILDEFDINLHPDILPHLLDWFIKAENNPKHAQILFTTHNVDIMDILGRYRTYLFEKEDGESFCYRLDEPKSPSLRNDRPLSVPYRKHLIGGFPKIGTKED